MLRFGRDVNGNYNVWFINAYGYFDLNGVTPFYSVRPVFFLKSDIQFLGGTGIISDPFIIS